MTYSSVDRFAIAGVFRDIAAWLVFTGDGAYRARAYLRGADVIEAAEGFDALLAAGRLTELPGIGDGLARQAAEIAATGGSSLLTKLVGDLPRGLPAVQAASGLAPAKVIALYRALGICDIDGLTAALAENKIETVAGFTAKTVERITKALQKQAAPTRLTRNQAEELAQPLIAFLSAAQPDCTVVMAGEMRRGCETVGELELVAVSAHPAAVLQSVERYPLVAQLGAKEPGAIRVVLRDGERVRVTVSDPADQASALLSATGPLEHVQRIEAAWSGAPSGLDEPGLYAAAGFAYVPPELREHPELLRTGPPLPALLNIEDLRGMVHCHTLYSDGKNTIEEMARAAQSLGFAYLTITDHSPTAHYANGVEADRLRRQWDEIARVQQSVTIRILRGTESDITQEGALDYPDAILEQLDVIIASIHSRHKQDSATMTARIVRALEHPLFKIWGHALGRMLLSRDPIDCDVEAIFDAAARSRAAIEINGDPHRLDLPPALIPSARVRGIRFVVSTDAHSVANLRNLRHGVAIARRGGLTKADVLNTLPAEEFLAAVRPA